MDNNICVICKAGFPDSSMKGNKCLKCHGLYPDAESVDDLRNKNTNVKAETMSESVVRRMIYDVLAEAGIKRHKCDKCSSLYYRTSPAQKTCSVCREKASK